MKKAVYLLIAVCLCCPLLTASGAELESPAGSADLSIDNEDDAYRFAEAFFTSPYVDGLSDGCTMTITHAENSWQAVLAPADTSLPTLTLRFAASGRIQQYQNSDYVLPTLDGFSIEEDISFEEINNVDTLRVLLPHMENNTCAVYAREGNVAYYNVDTFYVWLGLAMGEPTPELVAYCDLETDGARYPGYLSRAEAEEAAKLALAETYGSAAEQADHYKPIQADFVLQEGLWPYPDMPLPYWFLVLGDEAGGLERQYEVLIDAATGEILEINDSAAIGNG